MLANKRRAGSASATSCNRDHCGSRADIRHPRFAARASPRSLCTTVLKSRKSAGYAARPIPGRHENLERGLHARVEGPSLRGFARGPLRGACCHGISRRSRWPHSQSNTSDKLQNMLYTCKFAQYKNLTCFSFRKRRGPRLGVRREG
jgi:hypothetical protein